MNRFSDAQDHFARDFVAAWPGRGLSARDLADICQRLARHLAWIDPVYGDVRLNLYPRPFRPSDPGPILDMSGDELAGLIDRRARFDPPRFPKPVSEDGYWLTLGPDRSGLDPRTISLFLRGGSYGEGAWDDLKVEPHIDSPIWQDVDLARNIIDDLIDITACHCVSASALITEGPRGYRRPWMIWVAEGAGSPLPVSVQFSYETQPVEVTKHKGGVLKVWN